MAEVVPLFQANEPPAPDVLAIRRLIAPEQTVAFVSGKFNVIHPGHLRLLRFAAESADFLIVGVLPDTADGITVPAALRLDALEAISFVNHACLVDEDLEYFLAQLRPDLVVKGKEYEERENAESAVLASYGGKLLFSSGEVSFSSLQLIQREYYETDFSSIRKPRDYLQRHGFSFRDLRQQLDAFADLKVLVVGDLIVDTYITCDPIGMSQEDPTIVVTPIEQKTFLGGAGIVAAHARGLGATVRFLTVVGDDDKARFARDALEQYGVDAEFLVDPSRPTTHKQRFRAHGKTLLRVNELRQHGIDTQMAARFLSCAKSLLDDTDLILFSDFNYGCLPQPVVDAIATTARKADVWMAADSQASSQMADISRFKGMNLITPTEREARLALGNFEDGLSVIADELQQKAQAENVIITLGAEGLLAYGRDGGAYMVDRLPALNLSPKDVAGAGDSLYATTALALRSGADIWSATYLGAIAAACQVSRVGNMPLKRQDLIKELLHPGS